MFMAEELAQRKVNKNMAPNIDWINRIIEIRKSDLTHVSGKVYQMDLNEFRLQLKDLEDDEGIVYVDTHRHSTAVNLGGVTLARVIEIINDYTITFENGVYAVNLVGANSNVADVLNLNQVSVRSNNSAGLINTTIDAGSTGTSGITDQDKDDIVQGVRDSILDEPLDDHNVPNSISDNVKKTKTNTNVIPSLL